MIYKVRTQAKPLKIILQVETDQPRDIIFIGYDPYRSSSEYFQRKKRIQTSINGKFSDQVIFPLPQAPKRYLHVMIFDAKEGERRYPKSFRITSFKTEQLQTSRQQISPQHTKNIEFIEGFARNCTSLRAARIYDHPGADFKIEYLHAIFTENGKESSTPARIHKQTNTIQVSRRNFASMTIPMRVMILLHEYSHNFINYDKDNEKEADYNALELYQWLGYPDTEAMYALSKMHSYSYEMMDRIRSLYYQVEHKTGGNILP